MTSVVSDRSAAGITFSQCNKPSRGSCSVVPSTSVPNARPSTPVSSFGKYIRPK